MLITIPNPGTSSFVFGVSIFTSCVDVVELVEAFVEVSADFTSVADVVIVFDFTSGCTEVVVSVV